MLRDRALIDAMSSEASELRLYLTQQPCHFSSSNDRNSCTENLMRWWKEWLEPRGVQRLRIRAAYPYRAHWDEAHMSEDDLAGLGRRQWGSGGGGKGRGGGGRGRGRGGMSHNERREAIERARRLLANAREGTRRLVAGAGGETSSSSGVSLESFDDSDWDFVLSVCDERTRELYDSGAEPFTAEVKGRRAEGEILGFSTK